MISGWYYMHKNRDLIFKRNLEGTVADLCESPFVVMLWPFDSEDRSTVWRLLVEALCIGANPERIQELSLKWECNDEDAHKYAGLIGVVLEMDGPLWCAKTEDFTNLQESPSGFGATCLEAMAELCRELGFKPVKMWGVTFHDLVKKGIE